ncbi:hypothetical protein [Peribacillus sp. SCS-155]|uniref:YphA family membrane protein n=1 Tax=Peribacillus sedimenti TaxID=3115297 RepID=UPI003905C571
MDGLFFYWILWIAWVLVMFFVPKETEFRYPFLFHILAVILFSTYKLHLFSFKINLACIYTLIFCFYYHRKLSVWKLTYLILGSAILALGLTSFQLFSMLDPVWLVVSPAALLGVLINYVAVLLFDNWRTRFTGILIALIIGDCLFAGILVFNSMPYEAGSHAWLDTAMVAILINVGWTSLETVSRVLHTQALLRFGQKERQV